MARKTYFTNRNKRVITQVMRAIGEEDLRQACKDAGVEGKLHMICFHIELAEGRFVLYWQHGEKKEIMEVSRFIDPMSEGWHLMLKQP